MSTTVRVAVPEIVLCARATVVAPDAKKVLFPPATIATILQAPMPHVESAPSTALAATATTSLAASTAQKDSS